jgi:hypothetical protein
MVALADAADARRAAANMRARWYAVLALPIRGGAADEGYFRNFGSSLMIQQSVRAARASPAGMTTAPAAAGAKSLMRITQYNLLAQCYVRSAIFTHSPGPSLKCAPRAIPTSPAPGADREEP